MEIDSESVKLAAVTLAEPEDVKMAFLSNLICLKQLDCIDMEVVEVKVP